LADRVIVFDGEPGIDARANAPESLLTGCNKFLKNLDVTFRRDPTNFRPRINKLNSQLDQEQKLSGNYVRLPPPSLFGLLLTSYSSSWRTRIARVVEKGNLEDSPTPSADALPGVMGLASTGKGHNGSQGLLDEEMASNDDDDPDD